MSKIKTEFKLKDLYAIKHALEDVIEYKESCINDNENLSFTELKIKEETDLQYTKDIEHEKQIVDYIVGVISKYKDTEVHY